jgi:hypothetical protein
MRRVRFSFGAWRDGGPASIQSTSADTSVRHRPNRGGGPVSRAVSHDPSEMAEPPALAGRLSLPPEREDVEQTAPSDRSDTPQTHGMEGVRGSNPLSSTLLGGGVFAESANRVGSSLHCGAPRRFALAALAEPPAPQPSGSRVGLTEPRSSGEACSRKARTGSDRHYIAALPRRFALAALAGPGPSQRRPDGCVWPRIQCSGRSCSRRVSRLPAFRELRTRIDPEGRMVSDLARQLAL